MAETGKLGIADSLLANVQLALAAADPTPPAITTQGGSLGGQLGDTILALAEVDGPLTFNLSAGSALALAQTADPAPAFVAHSTPDYVLGGHDSQLGAMEPAFAGAAVATPSLTGQTGCLGTALGKTVLGLGGAAGPLVYNLAAQSALAIAQTADPAPSFVAHESPHWVLGGQDSYLGGIELAFAGVADPRPVTGSLTGKLGTAGSLLGGVRLALGLEEGEGTGGIVTAAAASELSLSSEAVVAAVRPVSASDTLSLGSTADCAAVRPLTAESTISADTMADCAAVRPLTAESVLALTDAATGIRVCSASAESTLSLDSTGGATAVRSLTAESVLDLTTEAARNNLPNLSAESALSLDTAAGFVAARALSAESVISATATAGFTAVHVMAAESVLELTSVGEVGAQERAAESILTLDTTADCAVVRQLTADSALDLATEAGRNNLLAGVGESVLALAGSADTTAGRSLAAESTISVDVTAGGLMVRPVAAESVLALTDEAAEYRARSAVAESALSLESTASVKAVHVVAAESAIGLTSAAWHTQILLVSAESVVELESTAHSGLFPEADASSELSLSDEASCTHVVGHRGEVWDWLMLFDWATVSVVRALKAENTIELVSTEHTARPWYVAAESPVQTIELVYDPEADDLVEQITGLDQTASAARPLTAAAHHSIPLHQTASAVRVKPTAIAVSAESVLELLGEVRRSPNAHVVDWLSLRQTATVEKCKLVRSRLDLSQEAAVIVSVPRGAASALGLSQAATYSIVSRGSLQNYTPFVGEGPGPTPPPVVLEAPEHVALPFQLFYPAEGVVTDTLTLRAPNLGNKDRLSFNRILRETRGGTLIVFADPIWPKIQTLVLTFSGLRTLQARQLLAFLETHLGEEIGLLDWEGRAWKGIVTAPTEPVVQDGKDSFSASLEFEGELVPA